MLVASTLRQLRGRVFCSLSKKNRDSLGCTSKCPVSCSLLAADDDVGSDVGEDGKGVAGGVGGAAVVVSQARPAGL